MSPTEILDEIELDGGLPQYTAQVRLPALREAVQQQADDVATWEATAQAVQNEMALTQEFLREAKQRITELEQQLADQHGACEVTNALSTH